MDDSRIRSKTAPFSFENGLVCTDPQSESRERTTKVTENMEGTSELTGDVTLVVKRIYHGTNLILLRVYDFEQ